MILVDWCLGCDRGLCFAWISWLGLCACEVFALVGFWVLLGLYEGFGLRWFEQGFGLIVCFVVLVGWLLLLLVLGLFDFGLCF